MSFPLPNGRRLVGRLWGPREWNGRTLNHDGIDQTLGDGVAVVVEHGGELAAPAPHRMDDGSTRTIGGIGHDRIFGFYAMYQVTPELRVSYHQLRAAGRGARELVAGETVIGLVGSPLVSLPLATRRTRANWSGPEAGLSDRSGPHLHSQAWRWNSTRRRWEPINPDDPWVIEQVEESMSLTDEQIEKIAAAVAVKTWNHPIGEDGQSGKANKPAWQRLGRTAALAELIHAAAEWLKTRIGGSWRNPALSVVLGQVAAQKLSPKDLAAAIVSEMPKRDAEALVDALGARLRGE